MASTTAVADSSTGVMQPKSLDHFVILVRDANVAAEAYERLGFHVRPLAEHEAIGSRNRVVHFEETYLEFIDLSGSLEEVAGPYLDRFELGEGLTHVSLTSDNLERDQEALRAQGLSPYPIISARRKISMPDGEPAETGSSCFYLWREENRYLSLFFSAHPKPETIFIPGFVNHANGAREVARCVYLSSALEEDRAYFSTCFAFEPEVDEAERLCWRGPRGDLTEILSKGEAKRRYGALLQNDTPGRFPGMGIALHYRVGDLTRTRAVLADSGVAFTELPDGGLAVAAEHAVGCAIVFEA